ncbi:MAG: hypothetical protein DRP61_04655 [Candidatus Omnitrophota bacterium]|nr:MAG: hypothetical protein DRP61_04655 [Candidatus Omnitrophota bacterium]RKY34584.1 MAG: hypothetical protein DRP69_04250 [Candidatus Omnitrophota bacterium]RKY43689.1 MAG: hypothetical protein DRP80_04585 [Candidatus Omnitrophota bacterium]
MKKILVVDDESEIRELLKLFLERKGFLVSLASTPREFEKLLKKEKVEALILDYTFFEENIEELIIKVKSLNKDSKIFILSGFSSEILERELSSQGLVEAIFSKAEDIGKIVERISQVLS